MLLATLALCFVLSFDKCQGGPVFPFPEDSPYNINMYRIYGMRPGSSTMLQFVKDMRPARPNPYRLGLIKIDWSRLSLTTTIFIRGRRRYNHKISPASMSGLKTFIERRGKCITVIFLDATNQVLSVTRSYCFSNRYAATHMGIGRSSALYARAIEPATAFAGLFQKCGQLVPPIREVTKTMCMTASILRRVTGGDPAAAGANPWQVALLETKGSKLDHICGGTLIGECAVVTAGHCFFERDVKRYKVRVGDYFNREDPEGRFREYEDPRIYNVTEIIVHPDYRYRVAFESPVNDIVLLALEKDSSGRCVRFGKFAQPACLASRDVDIVRDHCKISGWGAERYGQSLNTYTSCLLFAKVNITDTETCAYKDGMFISKKMICANGMNSQGVTTDTCQGDSGGPLICNQSGNEKGILVGVTSFGDKCGGAKAGVYTKVETYYSWVVRQLMKSNNLKTKAEARLLRF